MTGHLFLLCMTFNGIAYEGWKCFALTTRSSVMRKTTLFWNLSVSIQATSRLTSENSAEHRAGLRSGAQNAILEMVITFNRCVKCTWCRVKVPDTLQLKFKQKTNTQVIILHSDSELFIVFPLGRMFSNDLSAINLKILPAHFKANLSNKFFRIYQKNRFFHYCAPGTTCLHTPQNFIDFSCKKKF